MSRQDERVVEIIAHEAAKFIAREAGLDSLITVTRALPASRGERVTVEIQRDERPRPNQAGAEQEKSPYPSHIV